MRKLAIRFFLLAGCLFLFGTEISATHNRAGQITYVQIGELTIRITITTWTRTSSVQADRDSLTVFWGDGSFTTVQRANGNGEPLENDIKKNIYIAEHTYPGRGTYTISMTDPNRISGILNVNYPNSVFVPFYLETTFTFLNPQIQGLNNSAVLLQPPIDYACLGEVFIHNPNAYDPDGDSLAYELIIPFQGVDSEVPLYRFPDEIEPGPDNQISLDPLTGDFVWDAPQRAGEYNIAIMIHEFRNGILINSTIRDMQILVLATCLENKAPQIEVDDEICVVAGDVVELDVHASDPDSNQLLAITALGGPFELEYSPSVFEAPVGYTSNPLNGKFIWQTACEHISEQFYTVVFRAVDNFRSGEEGLATLKTVRIKVVGPAPEDISVENIAGQMRIEWSAPYNCEVTANDYFRGFSVWKRVRSEFIQADTCNPGLSGSGYQKIAFNLRDQQNDRYFYVDQDVERGTTYCYRVLAEFARVSTGGQFYNRVEGLPSEEVCESLNKDLAFLTEVSVVTTDVSQGSIRVSWLKPDPSDLDTVMNPGPYRYELHRATGVNGTNFIPVPGGTFVTSSLTDPVDTSILDMNLNTIQNAYRYQIRFFTGGSTTARGSSEASSIFQNVFASDRTNTISWDENVPWNNYQYTIFLRRDQGQLDSIGVSFQEDFVHGELENGRQYCYLVRTRGTYGIQGFPDPLVNWSQEVCSTPVDTMAPCAPAFTVSNICSQPDLPVDRFENLISWTHPSELCPELGEVRELRLYYRPTIGAGLEHIATLTDPVVKEFLHSPEQGISGCYVMTAIDQAGNEVCVDNCPFFELPNAFSPNGDGANDLYRPFDVRFISRIEFKVYNRWGQLVFETSDPEINWDGTNFGGSELASGTYYYACSVYELRVEGEMMRDEKLVGYIQLIR